MLPFQTLWCLGLHSEPLTRWGERLGRVVWTRPLTSVTTTPSVWCLGMFVCALVITSCPSSPLPPLSCPLSPSLPSSLPLCPSPLPLSPRWMQKLSQACKYATETATHVPQSIGEGGGRREEGGGRRGEGGG